MQVGGQMKGKIFGIGLMSVALIAGAAMYYLQVYAYYGEIPADQGRIELTLYGTDQREEIVADDFQGIDAESSPLRYRACFTTIHSTAMLSETYVVYERAEPLTTPGWFGCFNPEEIGAALENGTAMAFLGQANVQYGFDRVVAVMDDGRGFSWQQINSCGERVYDGEVNPAGCPPKPEGK
jgi:hypothetical protein